MTTWYVFETLTGRILSEFVPLNGSWDSRLNEPDKVDVSIALYDPLERERDWRNLALPWKHSLAVEESGRLYGGPIQPHAYDDNAQTLKITALGIESVFDRRTVLPLAALTTPLVTAAGVSNPALATSIRGVDLGTIAKKLLQQAMSWPGSGLPIVFEADRAGIHTWSCKAIEQVKLMDAIDKLTDLENGPDYAFRLERADSSRFEWHFVTGTQTQPRLQSVGSHTWDLSAENASGSGLAVTTNAGKMGSLAWATTGGSSSAALASRQYDATLVAQGYPLLELIGSSQSGVTQQAVLDGVALAQLRTSRKPSEFWSFEASLSEVPSLQEYRVGDLCSVTVQDDPYIPDQTYARRIVALSGDEQGDWVKITCGEVYDG